MMPADPQPSSPEHDRAGEGVASLSHEPPRDGWTRKRQPLNVDQVARRSCMWGWFFLFTPIPPAIAIYYGLRATRMMTEADRSRARQVSLGIGMGMIGLATWVLICWTGLQRFRHMANDMNCMSNLRDVSLCLINYATQNRDALPDDLDVLVQQKYLSNTRLFVCRESTAGATVASPQSSITTYLYLGKGRTLRDFRYKTPLLVDIEPHGNDGFNAAFADGSVRKLTPSEWRDLLEQHLAATTRPSR
jgi:prepilin-type processing-associated H-X9-DG protein